MDETNGEPLAGASIIIVEFPGIGTTTDFDGNYVLALPEGSENIRATYIGYRERELPIGGTMVTLDIALSPEIASLDEVVLIGYGTKRRRDLTGAVSSVSEAEIKEVIVTSFDQALKGRSAGVQVTQTSGVPGGGVSIRIRGGNSITAGNEPLFVIDGVPVLNDNRQGASRDNTQPLNTLSTLNPNDIASIDILKDASATAIYGARAANGVVLVTTKRGSSGKGRLNLSVYTGFQEVPNPIDMLDAREFAVLVNEANTNAGREAVFDLAAIDNDTDWQDVLFRSAPIQNYQLSLSNGNEKGNYYMSGNYFSQEGTVRGSGFDRISFRFNGNQEIFPGLKSGNTVSLTRTSSDRVSTDGGNSVVRNALRISPTLPVRDQFGDYTFGGATGGGVSAESNPLFRAEEITNENFQTRFLGSAFLEYSPITGLTLKTQVGTDLIFGKNNYYIPREPRGDQSFAGLGFAAVQANESRSVISESSVSFKGNLGDHSFDVLGGFSFQNFRFERLESLADSFPTDEQTFYNLDAATRNVYFPLQAYDRSAIISYLARANYDYQGRYLLTASVRTDGSSKFGDGNKWGVFPSVAAAWRISDEPFLREASGLDNLKLRLSFGITGNQDIPSYSSLGQVREANYVFDEQKTIGQTLITVSNPDLKWETTAQTNIGLDATFWKGGLSVTADYYYKKTTDLLFDVSLPRTTGFATSVQNIGELENEGLELSINTVNIDSGDFYWDTNFNFTTNRSEVLGLGQETERLINNVNGILRVGEPVGSFFGYRTDGIFQNAAEVAVSAQPGAAPGDRRFVDISGPDGIPDGAITSEDRTIIGQAQPKWFAGLGSTFRYKGLDLSFLMQGTFGNDVNNQTTRELLSLDGRNNNSTLALQRWTPQNPSNTIPRATFDAPPFRFSDFDIEDGSFVRMTNITAGYSLDKKALDRIALAGLRIYGSVQNVFTITDYSGYDPEVNRFGQSTLSVGADYYGYPNPRIWTIGLEASF